MDIKPSASERFGVSQSARSRSKRAQAMMPTARRALEPHKCLCRDQCPKLRAVRIASWGRMSVRSQEMMGSAADGKWLRPCEPK